MRSDDFDTVRLVQDARGGDEVAYCELVKHYGPLIRSLCAMRASDPSRSDDVAQQVFVMAWKRLPELREPEAFQAWLESIARHYLLNEWRRVERERRMKKRYAAARLAQAEADRLDALEHAEEMSLQIDSLRQCLQQLPPELRKLVHLRYEDNRNSLEISEMTGRSADAVRQTFVRVREKLRECIERRMVSKAAK